MRHFTSFILVVGALALAAPTQAQTIDLSWDACTPIVTHKTAQPGIPAQVFATVTGHSQGHKGYEVWFIVGDKNHQIPDAWRFEPGGCNAGLFSTSSQPPSALAKSCPPFMPAATQNLVISAWQFATPASGSPTTMGNGCFAMAYPAGIASADPGTRYHLVTFTLDFTNAVFGVTDPGTSCGGLGTEVTLSLAPNRGSWLTFDGQSEIDWEVGNGQLTFGTGDGGPSIPAQPVTWGQLKGQYRH